MPSHFKNIPHRDVQIADARLAGTRSWGNGNSESKLSTVGHHHTADEKKFHLIAGPTQFSDEYVPCQRALQQRQALVTTESYEVEMALSVITVQFRRHCRL